MQAFISLKGTLNFCTFLDIPILSVSTSRKISIHLAALHTDVSSPFEEMAVFTQLAHADRISRLKLLSTKSYTVLEKKVCFSKSCF